jgi:trimeric autotransporter adhesin
MRTSVVLCLFVFLCVSAHTAAASPQQNSTETSVPHLVQFTGLLKDAAARPISGAASVTFSVYADQEGGAALWSETQNVLADASGHYSIVLGAATTGGFPVELFGTGQSRWLGVAIARQTEMPRILMASVPYALKAGDADTLGGLPASSYVTTQQLAASNARTATTVIDGGSTIVAAPTVMTASTSQASVTPEAQQSSVTDATPTGSGTTDYIPLWTSGSNLGNSLLFQTGGKLGIGITAPASTLDINGGEILRGGFYEYPQGNATASAGQPSHSFQWMTSVFDSSTSAPVYRAFGFRAIPQNNDTTNPSASLDLFYGTGGPTGSISDTGLSIAPSGVVTFVPSQTFSGSTSTVSNAYVTDTLDLGLGNPNAIMLGGFTFLTVHSATNLYS